MIRSMALYLFALGLLLPPATVLAGLVLLAIPRRAAVRPFSRASRAA
jgi:hypothetical protein